MTDVFGGLAGVLGLAAVGGVAAKALKQPAIIGYLAAGLLISASGWRGYGNNEQIIRLLGTMGVTLLLFLAGMELPLSELRRMGKVSLITGICQIIITSLVGWGISRILGFGPAESVFLGIGLTFGSTILVIKLLSEKKSLDEKISNFQQRQTGWIEPMRNWITQAQSLGKVANENNLFSACQHSA